MLVLLCIRLFYQIVNAKEGQRVESLQFENSEVLAIRFYNSIFNGHSFIHLFINLHFAAPLSLRLTTKIHELKLNFVEFFKQIKSIYCIILGYCQQLVTK